MGHPFLGVNTQQYAHTSIFTSVFRYIVVGQKNIVSVLFTLKPTPWAILSISLAKYLIQTGLLFGFLT